MSTDKIRARVELHTGRAAEALAALQKARTNSARLEAAQALESAACQLRRALKQAQ